MAAPHSPDVYKYDVRPSGSVHSTPTTNRYAQGGVDQGQHGPPPRRSPGSPSLSMYFSPTVRRRRAGALGGGPLALCRRAISQALARGAPLTLLCAQPQKTVSVLSRPRNPPPSQKNVENLDTQFERDKQAADRHAAAFRRLQVERWHHHGPGTPSLLDQGHIVDRGRGKTVVQAANGVYDPILSEFKVPPWGPPVQGSRDNKRPARFVCRGWRRRAGRARAHCAAHVDTWQGALCFS